MRTAVAYIAILLLAGCATTGPTSSTRYWKLDGCTNAPNPRVNFNRSDGTRVATIDRLVCERLQTAATKIQNAASYQVSQIYISDLEAVNAFATFDKNGQPIVIANIGMLQAIGADEDAWAGLLGHEIAHLVRNHREGRQEAKSAAKGGGQVVGNILSHLIPGVGGWAAGTVAGTATQWAMYGAYTRPQEAEADQLGLTWMVAAGYDPRGLTRLFDILAKQSSPPAFLSTHPGAEDRAKIVQDYVNKTRHAVASPDVGQGRSQQAVASPVLGQQRLPPCPGSYNAATWTNCVGELTSPTGANYVGEFRDGKFNGQGTYTFPNGAKYVGEYKDSRRNGQGTYSYSDGRKYVGEYRDGMRNGQGIEYRPDGTILQSGTWKNDLSVTGQ